MRETQSGQYECGNTVSVVVPYLGEKSAALSLGHYSWKFVSMCVRRSRPRKCHVPPVTHRGGSSHTNTHARRVNVLYICHPLLVLLFHTVRRCVLKSIRQQFIARCPLDERCIKSSE